MIINLFYGSLFKITRLTKWIKFFFYSRKLREIFKFEIFLLFIKSKFRRNEHSRVFRAP